ncbi:transketolase [Candidatus Parcubacteria bacterium]|nr:MAG: transketolase [Candidatus Parcubacteria bacterium]
MSECKFQRDSFFDRLYERARADRNIILVAADMSAPTLDKFRTDLPSQFVNVGIAEQNAIVVASGLALAGKKVFAYAISPFITLRALEQIRVSNCIMNIPLTIVGMGTGLSYENDGPTHHLVEDIAVMRAFPNITIHNITDAGMARAFVDLSCDKTTTNYIRLDKDAYPDLYEAGFDFSQGMAQIRGGKDCLLLTSGVMAHVAMEVAHTLQGQGIDIGVVDLFEIPLRRNSLLDLLRDCRRLVTLEEHFLPGGLGSAVYEVLGDANRVLPMKRIGMSIEDGYAFSYKYGGRNVIRKHHGIDAASVCEKVAAFIRQ